MPFRRLRAPAGCLESLRAASAVAAHILLRELDLQPAREALSIACSVLDSKNVARQPDVGHRTSLQIRIGPAAGTAGGHWQGPIQGPNQGTPSTPRLRPRRLHPRPGR